MRALMPPATALGSSFRKEISAQEHSAVISQNTTTIRRLAESTSPTIAPMKKSTSA